ncbi:MAG: GAP family protein [Solirubrobacterales bacterium]
MTRLTLIVLSIGLADSLNPTTAGPALYLATTRHARRQVAEFAIGIFAVNLIGGALIALGPGQLLLALVPHPSPVAKHLTEVAVGAAFVIAAAILWTRRRQMAARALPGTGGRTGASAVLGAGIALVELPTAFPYFAAIAAIVASGAAVGEQVALLVLFNLAFIAPVLGILFVLIALGPRADPVLRRASDWLQREWPTVLSVLGMAIGAAILAVGAVGLAGD